MRVQSHLTGSVGNALELRMNSQMMVFKLIAGGLLLAITTNVFGVNSTITSC